MVFPEFVHFENTLLCKPYFSAKQTERRWREGGGGGGGGIKKEDD